MKIYPAHVTLRVRYTISRKKHQLPYWRFQIDIMVGSSIAWREFRTTSFEAGIAAMGSVAARQVPSESTPPPSPRHVVYLQ